MIGTIQSVAAYHMGRLDKLKKFHRCVSEFQQFFCYYRFLKFILTIFFNDENIPVRYDTGTANKIIDALTTKAWKCGETQNITCQNK